MAKGNAIYAPGELSRVRDKLGVTDDAEAKRMAELLGGEVGTEREIVPTSQKGGKDDTSFGKSKRRRIDLAGDEDEGGKSKGKQRGPYPGDDPTVPVKLNYSERVKIDQYAGQVIFEIKTALQVLISIFSFFREPVDYVSPRFVIVRMNEYFNKIERLVNAARSLFPKSNKKRDNQLRRVSPFVYKLFDTIRSWDIETLAKNIASLQAHPRSVKVTDFAEVLRDIYKPLYIIEDLNIENIKTAFKLIYKLLYIESPMDAKEKYQEVIRNIIASIADIRRNVQFGLYPLLMKLISNRFIIYERFFIERRRRYMAFLNVTEAHQLNSLDLSPQQIDSIDVETIQKDTAGEEEGEGEGEAGGEKPKEGDGTATEEKVEEDGSDPKVAARRAKEDSEKAEYKSMEQGLTALEVLFPKAGWDKLDEFPDLYPYFSKMYGMRHGYELIAPSDPLQQVSVLLHILDDLFIGLRYVNFGIVAGPDGNYIKVSDEIGHALNNWRSFIEDSFSRDYLPRLTEYCRMLENSRDSRSTSYAKKNINELHWIKRLYFLPYYKFESIGPPPFPKQDIIPIYTEIRKLRRNLTQIALGIEQGVHAGGAAAKAACNGISNPWVAYNFQVPNPISKRLDLLLPPEKRINATLVFFSLSVVTVADYLVNNENSWAYSYGNRPGPLFRSIKDEGIIPLFGVDDQVDTDKLFKDSLKKPSA
ncbi:MAG: hypothetical protein LBI28_04240 [Treponema sp.]|jgi:hypothetical protein|nr:hypothetical protein [Treponema sp.]